MRDSSSPPTRRTFLRLLPLSLFAFAVGVPPAEANPPLEARVADLERSRKMLTDWCEDLDKRVATFEPVPAERRRWWTV